MNVFVFDIETVPDVDGARRIYGLSDLDDGDVAKAMYHKRMQEAGTDFLRHHLHRIVAISAVLRSRDQLKVWSLGTAESSESELLQRFFGGIEKYTPTLVSWNGGGFDLPVIHYRALLKGVQAPRYWDNGDDDRQFRYNNYLNRFHYRHTDLMDVLAGYQNRACAPLDQIATLLGFPGKLGMDGSQVWDHYQQGDVEGIRQYCETDVLNTFLVYLRWSLIRGELDPQAYQSECQRVREFLRGQDAAHFQSFLKAWADSSA